MKKISNIFSVLSGVCLAVVFIITFAQVIERYVFKISIPWATDIVQMFFLYSVFFGMGVGIFRKSHLNIDVLIQVFPSHTRVFFDLLSNAVVFVFLSIVFFFSFKFAKANADQFTTYIMIPMIYIYMIVPITIAFMLIFLILDSIKLLKSIISRGNTNKAQKK
jgi:TRAP-type C4-dicarboxylate transport system permease small subunit